MTAYARISLALVDVDTFPSLGLVTRITEALKATFSVDALAMMADTSFSALVDVSAKGSVWCKLKADLTRADIRAQSVRTPASETAQRVFTALVCIDARESRL